MFWNTDRLPRFIAACLATAERLNPDWTFTVLHPTRSVADGTVDPFPGDATEDAQHQADFFRLSALANHGGVWLDATTIHLLPLTAWVDAGSASVQGFVAPPDSDHLPPPYNGSFSSMTSDLYMETWAFAAPANSSFMAQWRDNYAEALRVGRDNYATPGLHVSSDIVGVLAGNGYLALNVAWRAAYAALPQTAFELVSSTDIGRPLAFLRETDWDACEMARRAVGATADAARGTAFFKLRGAERGCIEQNHMLECMEPSYVSEWMLSSLRQTHLNYTGPAEWGACPEWPAWVTGLVIAFSVLLGLALVATCFFLFRRGRQPGATPPSKYVAATETEPLYHKK